LTNTRLTGPVFSGAGPAASWEISHSIMSVFRHLFLSASHTCLSGISETKTLASDSGTSASVRSLRKALSITCGNSQGPIIILSSNSWPSGDVVYLLINQRCLDVSEQLNNVPGIPRNPLRLPPLRLSHLYTDSLTVLKKSFSDQKFPLTP